MLFVEELCELGYETGPWIPDALVRGGSVTND